MIVVEWGTQVDNGLAHIVFNGITPTVAPAFAATDAQAGRAGRSPRAEPRAGTYRQGEC
jgi:hypothetical protein